MSRSHFLERTLLAMGLLLASGRTGAAPAPRADLAPMDRPLLEAMTTWDDYFRERWLDRGVQPPRGTGYKPFQRWKWIIERRLDEHGRIDPMARWRAFEAAGARRKSMPATDASPQWTSMGPDNTGGRVISHAFDPFDRRTLWVGSASGGLWRTQDAGETWEPMTDHLPSLSVSAIALHPATPGTMLIATGEAFGGISAEGVGVLKSTDGGAHWARVSFAYPQSEGIGCFALAWDPVTTGNVYLAATNGLWASRDAGDTWVLLKPGRFVALVLDRSDPRRLYAAEVEVGGPDATGRLWRSLDAGATWHTLTSGLPEPLGFTSLAICDAAPNVLYASIDKAAQSLPCLYKSVDGGDHWQALVNAPGYLCYPAPWVGCQGWYANVVAVSPWNPDVVFAGGIHLYRSTDGGASWSVSGGLFPDMVVHVDHHSFGFDPEVPDRVFSFNDGGVFRSDDLGASWAPKQRGLVTFQYYALASSPFSPGLTSGGSQDNGTHLIDGAGGNAGSRQWGPFADGGVSVFDHTRAGVIHGEEQSGTHFKSLDGGATWHYTMNGITESGPWVTPVAMDPLDSDILHTSSRTGIYRSIDAGESWQRVRNANMVTAIAVDRNDPAVVYAGSYFEAVLHRSLDRGATWAAIPAPWTFGLSDLESDPSRPGVVYATMATYSTMRPRVWRSTDRGLTWASVSGDLPTLPVNCITMTGLTPGELFVGTDLGVYRSTTDGLQWEPFNGTLPNVMVFDMHWQPADSTLRVGTHGRGAWKIALASPGTVGAPQGPGGPEFGTAFPNPFASRMRMAWRIDRPSHVTIALFDVSGRRVRLLAEGVEAAGTRTLEWDGTDEAGRAAPSGVYLCRIEARALAGGPLLRAESRKLLKIR